MTGVLAFALGGGVTIFALIISFSGGAGLLIGPILGFFGFLGLGAGLNEIVSSGKAQAGPTRPLSAMEKIGILVVSLGVVALFLPLAVGVFFGYTFILPIALVVAGAIVVALGGRGSKDQAANS